MPSERAFWTREVADILHIGESTLRKWCIQLEKNSNVFTKGTNSSRAFIEWDIANLRRLKELIQEKGVTVDQAANLIVSMDSDDVRTPPVPQSNAPVASRHSRSRCYSRTARTALERQNEQLLKALEEQRQFIDRRLIERDQRMIRAIQEIRKNQQLTAAAAEEQQINKGFFRRFFS